jgi:hypothetical protein
MSVEEDIIKSKDVCACPIVMAYSRELHRLNQAIEDLETVLGGPVEVCASQAEQLRFLGRSVSELNKVIESLMRGFLLQNARYLGLQKGAQWGQIGDEFRLDLLKRAANHLEVHYHGLPWHKTLADFEASGVSL